MARFAERGWRNHFFLSLAASTVIGFLGVSAGAETVSIGVGTDVVEVIETRPLSTSPRELRVQIIYLAAEIGMQGEITSLEFSGGFGSDAERATWTIRMKHTSLPGFRRRWTSDPGHWEDVYKGSPVFSPRDGRLRFDLDRPCEYDGMDNLILDITMEGISPRDKITMRSFESDWPRTAYKVIGTLPSLPTSHDPRDLAGDFRLTRQTPNITLEIEPPEIPREPAADFPFHEGFETGTLAGCWQTYTHAYVGAAESSMPEVTPRCGPHSGSYHMRMTATGSGDSFVGAAILTIDLSGQENVVLEFWHKWFDRLAYRQLGCTPGMGLASTTACNGVAISENGEDWVAVIGLQPALTEGATHNYLQYFVDLDEAARQAEMIFNSHFKIKFQYGLTHFSCMPSSVPGDGCTHPCNLDPGVTLDDITVRTGNAPPEITASLRAREIMKASSRLRNWRVRVSFTALKPGLSGRASRTSSPKTASSTPPRESPAIFPWMAPLSVRGTSS